MIVALLVIGWIACGLPGARYVAAYAYAQTQRSQERYYGSRASVQVGRGSAIAWFIIALLLGPVNLLFHLADRTIVNSVPQLRKAEQDAQAKRVKELEEEIREAHRQLGIEPPKW